MHHNNNTTSSNHNRRRKKRPSYGVRTVELNRGRSGYGFTISGQAPCILSCIVSCSPAEKSGLRPGDYLIAVNGQNVSKTPHDDVVRLIGNSSGILKLQIAENYCSDSSEEELVVTVSRAKPKYPNRFRNKPNSSHNHHVYRAEKVVQDLQNGILFHQQQQQQLLQQQQQQRLCRLSPEVVIAPAGSCHRPRTPLHNVIVRAQAEDNLKQRSNKRRDHNRKPVIDNRKLSSHHGKENHVINPTVPVDWELYGDPLYRAVVGYLGTVEVPKEPQGTRMQVVRNCIRRLRVEKKVHTLVLLKVFLERVTLTNPHAITIAEYPADKITFSGLSSDDKKFFGLVTSPCNYELSDELDEPINTSSSCHVFMVDQRLVNHDVHLSRAKMFSINCGNRRVSGHAVSSCPEFPESADPILGALLSLYRNRPGGIPVDVPGGISLDSLIPPQQPQPHSNTSSNSSNSDSGIGFRDEGGNSSDRVFVVDVNHKQPQLQQRKNNNSPAVDKLTVRVMPDPVVSNQPSSTTSNSRFGTGHSSKSAVTLSGNSNANNKAVTTRMMSPVVMATSENLKMYKLSPKVYNLEFPPKISTSSELISVSAFVPTVPDTDTDVPDNLTETTGEQEGGSQDVHPPTQDEDSEYSELESVGIQRSSSKRDWMTTSSLQRQLSKLSSSSTPPPHASINGETGALSDGELVNGKHSSTGTSSMLGEFDCGESTCDSVGSATPGTIGRVASWAVHLDRLLEDPAGIHTMAEFLKKEFSHENIYFWVACERYRKLFTSASEETRAKAREIFERHLCLGAPEPVNVDSHARQVAQESLETPMKDLFLAAQKQIYNLMKFDCYNRFLKSNIYKDCLVKEITGQPLPYSGDDDLDPDLPYKDDSKTKPKKDEEPRRKSLLPWHRKSSKKSSSSNHESSSTSSSNFASNILNHKMSELRKSLRKKDSKESNSVVQLSSSAPGDVSGSRTSLASSDLAVMQRNCTEVADPIVNNSSNSNFSADNCALCRVILPDQSTTVVTTKRGESIGSMIENLLDKRGISFTAVELFLDSSSSQKRQSVDPSSDSCLLGCQEVRVEERILIRIDLPNRRTSVCLRANPNLTLTDALIPLLSSATLNIDTVVVHLVGMDKPLDTCVKCRTLDKEWIVVQSRDEYLEWGLDNRIVEQTNKPIQLRHPRSSGHNRNSDSEFTKLFQQMFAGKLDLVKFDKFGVFDPTVGSKPTTLKSLASTTTDENLQLQQRRHSSGLILGLVRRNSVHFDRDVTKRTKMVSTVASTHLGYHGHHHHHHPHGSGNRASIHESSNLRVNAVAADKPPIAPPNRRAGMMINGHQSTGTGRSENDELFEIWKRTQRSRLDDQRGTEINTELPDFLKLPCNNEDNCNKMSGNHLSGRASEPIPSSHCHWNNPPTSAVNMTPSTPVSPTFSQNFNGCSFTQVVDGILPTQQQAEELFSSVFGSSSRSPAFKDPKLTEKRSLKELGFPYHSRNDKSSLSADKSYTRSLSSPSAHIYGQQAPPKPQPPRPASHPIPQQFYVQPSIRSHQSLNLPEPSTVRSSSTVVTLSQNDPDVTLTSPLNSSNEDVTLTPSKLPPYPNLDDTTINADEADFPPPSPLSSQIQMEKQIQQTPPPPLPPKPKLPPPRPSFLRMTSLPSGHPSFPSNGSMTTGLTNGGSMDQNLSRSRKPMYVDVNEAFSISFV